MEHKIDKILCNPAQVSQVRTMLEKRGAYQSIEIVTASEEVKVGEVVIQDFARRVNLHFDLR